MKYLLSIAFFLTLVGCSSVKNTVDNDHRMRVSIDPKGIYDIEYTSLRQSLIENGKFLVVDRSEGFAAVLREQDLEHKSLSGRFSDSEKYARYAELEGPGSVIKN